MSNLESILKAVDELPAPQQKELLRHLAQRVAAAAPVEDLFKQQLLKAGLLSEIRPPVKDLSPYRDRKPVEVSGKPLSETVIEERR